MSLLSSEWRLAKIMESPILQHVENKEVENDRFRIFRKCFVCFHGFAGLRNNQRPIFKSISRNYMKTHGLTI
jgi:hypothetical protein